MPVGCAGDEEELRCGLKALISHPLPKPLKPLLVPVGPSADTLHTTHNYPLSCSQAQLPSLLNRATHGIAIMYGMVTDDFVWVCTHTHTNQGEGCWVSNSILILSSG